MRPRVLINWGLSSFFGYGVYGLNLAQAWARDPDLEPLCSAPFARDDIRVDPLRARVLGPTIEASENIQLKLAAAAREGQTLKFPGPVLVGLGNDFVTSGGPHKGPLLGEPTIAVPFIDRAQMTEDAVRRAQWFPLVIAGSTWNAQLLKAQGVERVVTVLQGIDPTLFHPAPRAGVMSDRFLVFSGGKLERRKGQDLVLAAFREFARRRPDVLLVTAWHSPWPQTARTLDVSGLAAPVPFHPNGRIDVAGWAETSGVPRNQVLDLGNVANAHLPALLREMDVALFPNRSEGGTNLVAMEAMACGAPTILSANTGHLDLVDEGAVFALERQAVVPGEEGLPGLGGWGESDVDEIVERLEQAYVDREDARRRGLAGARKLEALTWARTAQGVKDAILSVT